MRKLKLEHQGETFIYSFRCRAAAIYKLLRQPIWNLIYLPKRFIWNQFPSVIFGVQLQFCFEFPLHHFKFLFVIPVWHRRTKTAFLDSLWGGLTQLTPTLNPRVGWPKNSCSSSYEFTATPLGMVESMRSLFTADFPQAAHGRHANVQVPAPRVRFWGRSFLFSCWSWFHIETKIKIYLPNFVQIIKQKLMSSTKITIKVTLLLCLRFFSRLPSPRWKSSRKWNIF